jgi:hypothetical protein
MWAQRGLETPLYLFSVVWLTLFMVDSSRSRHWGWPAATVLLARPEGFYVLLSLAPFFGLNRDRLPELLRPALYLGVLLSVLSIARLFYFHDLLPQTFYSKFSGHWSVAPASFFVSRTHLSWLLLPVLLAAVTRRFWTRERAMLLFVAALMMLWTLMVREMKSHHRHFVPALPFVYILCISSFESLVRFTPALRRKLLYAFCLALLATRLPVLDVPVRRGRMAPNPFGVAAAELFAAPGAFLRSMKTKILSPYEFTRLDEPESGYEIGYNYQALVGKFIALNYPPDVTVVYDQMGQTPYLAGPDTVFIDSFGLTDRTAGLYVFELRAADSMPLRLYDFVLRGITAPLFGEEGRSHSRQAGLDYLFEAKPDLIMLNRFVVERRPETLSSALSRDPRLRGRYLRRFVLADLVEIWERVGETTAEPIVPRGLSVRDARVVRR